MRLSALHRIAECLFRRSIFPVAVTLLFLLASSLVFPISISAQTSADSTNSDNTFTIPVTDPDVPHNMHTFAQAALIEVMSSVMCVLSGIDIVNPDKPCLGINPVTHKIGYAPQSSQDQPQIGGMLGMTTNLISQLYTPPASSVDYFQYISENFGIVKTARAQQLPGADQWGYGFVALGPIMPVWRAVLNMAYLFLVLIFVIIGLGIMLRVKIDPRTVMTIQNQIPRVVICILLITFSYAIAGLMVDAMWTVTYMGINLVTNVNNPSVGGGQKLSQKATSTILQTPITYANQVFANDAPGPFGWGITVITASVSKGMGNIMRDLIKSLISKPGAQCFSWTGGFLGVFPHVDIGACFADLVGWISFFMFLIIIFVVILVTLFRIWFMLLKAYIYVLMYTVLAPIWIVFGLLPNRPLGFEKWIRSMFVNLAVFPLVAFLFVAARILIEIFNNAQPNQTFIPPLVGNPSMKDFGILLAFGMLLMGPTLIDWLRDSMKVPGTKHGGAIGGALAAGAAVPGAVAAKSWANLNYKNPTTGEAVGVLARKKQDMGNAALDKVSKVPGVGKLASTASDRRQYYQQHGTLHGFEKGADWKGNEDKASKRRTFDSLIKDDRSGFKPFVNEKTGKRWENTSGDFGDWYKQQQPPKKQHWWNKKKGGGDEGTGETPPPAPSGPKGPQPPPQGPGGGSQASARATGPAGGGQADTTGRQGGGSGVTNVRGGQVNVTGGIISIKGNVQGSRPARGGGALSPTTRTARPMHPSMGPRPQGGKVAGGGSSPAAAKPITTSTAPQPSADTETAPVAPPSGHAAGKHTDAPTYNEIRKKLEQKMGGGNGESA